MRFNTYRMRRGIRLLLLFTIVLIWFTAPAPGFSKAGQEEKNTALHVFVSIPPQAYLIQRIGGERISVGVLVQEGRDPHTFDPTPSTMARLSEADLYFRIGIEFEHVLLERITDTAPDLKIIDCRENITLRTIDDSQVKEEHAHYDEGDDPHIWMSVRNTITIADTIYNALVELDPEGKEIYKAGHVSLTEELTSLDRDLIRILQPVKGKKLFVFHPAFGYFADDYGLQQVAVEIGGNEPSARQLTGVIEEAKKQGARVIFVQPQFSQKSAQAIADAIGGAVVPIDSLAWDYIQNMAATAAAIEEALR